MKTRTRILNIPWAAAVVAAFVLTNMPAHAAPTVWNVNIGSDVTNYAGAAPENTPPPNTWNSFVTADLPAPKALVDSTGAAGTVTMAVTAATLPTIGGQNQAGADIFDTWMKAYANNVNFTITFAGLTPGDTYDLVVYADWWWNGAAMAITQTAGTGLAAPFVLNTGKTTGGADNDTGTLSEDTDPANVGSGTLNWNYTRLKTLTPDESGNLAFLFGAGNWPLSGFQLVKIDLGDTTPPDPSPMTWATAPAATGETSIAMTATTATDPSGVEYKFTETTDNPGATDGDWQDSPTYTDTGLTPGTTYTYTVTARDKAPAQTETTASTEESATTDPADTTPPATPEFDSGPIATSITKITMTATTVSDVSGVEYYFTETSGNSGGSDSGWQDSPVYTDGGLTPGTSYTYKVKARDKSIAQNPSLDSATASATTDTETVVSSVWNVNIGNEITTSDNFAGVAPENTVPNSFWNSVTANPTGLVLADATSSNSAGVTLTLTDGLQAISYGGYAPVTGIELFSTWAKSSDNASKFTMTIGGLSASKTYDLIVYSDWYWKGDGTLPLTLTAGTGLSGTVVLDQISTGTDGDVPALVEDTDPAANSSVEGNWLRINGLTPDVNGNLGFLMGGTNAAFSGFQLVYPAGVVSSGFTTWAAANAGGQTAGEDFDNDGVENGIEYFMGETGSSFTAMPGLDENNMISWPAEDDYQGTYEIQTSTDLDTWENVEPRPVPVGGILSYTLPPGAPGGKSFVRLLVTPTP